MANPLKQKLQDRLQALQAHRQETAQRAQAQLAAIDGQIDAIKTLAQQWDTLTVDQALAALNQAGILLELKA